MATFLPTPFPAPLVQLTFFASPLLAMRYQSTDGDTVAISSSTASAICDSLLRMAHSLIIELPEPELRETRFTLDSLLMKADRILDLMQDDGSFDLHGLHIGTGEPLAPVLTHLTFSRYLSPSRSRRLWRGAGSNRRLIGSRRV